jgi:hypothetical protein
MPLPSRLVSETLLERDHRAQQEVFDRLPLSNEQRAVFLKFLQEATDEARLQKEQDDNSRETSAAGEVIDEQEEAEEHKDAA